MNKFITVIFAACFLIVHSCSLADEPLELPKSFEVTSQNKLFAAISDPQKGTTVLDSVTRKEKWTIPGWHRSLIVSNDGEHLITMYGGLNLIPIDYDENMALITIWTHGKITQKISVKQIVPDKDYMRKTVSHYHWGDVIGVDGSDQLVIKRQDGQEFKIDFRFGLVK